MIFIQFKHYALWFVNVLSTLGFGSKQITLANPNFKINISVIGVASIIVMTIVVYVSLSNYSH